MLLCETFPAGPFQANCVVLGCGDSKEAVVVDPGGAIDQVAEAIARFHLEVKAVILTHGHIDHVMCTSEVVDAHGGEVMIHNADRALYESLPAQGMAFGLRASDPPPIARTFGEGDEITFGKQTAKVIHTPGHTPGSVCFQLQRDRKLLVLSGDTLFCRGIGRTDLPGGDTEALFASIRDRLYALPPDTEVLPGHGPATTIADEMRANPFVRA